MSSTFDVDARVTEQAVRWFSALLDSNDQRTDFFRWMEESPRHVEEFLHVIADAHDMASLTDAQRIRIEALSVELGNTEANESNLVPFTRVEARVVPSSQKDRHRRVPTGLAASFAAMLLVAVTSLWWFTGPGSWKSYATHVGEQRVVELADGSTVHLNTGSAISVRLGEGARRVRLLRGEALFSVTHDPRRPFLVQSSNAVVQAIGTRFIVYNRSRGTRVAVIEGVVQVSDDAGSSRGPDVGNDAGSDAGGSRSPDAGNDAGSDAGSGAGSATVVPAAPRSPDRAHIHLLAAGQAVEVSSAGGISQTESVDQGKVTAWQQRRLVFQDDTLGDIAAEFNRYNPKVRIRVLGDAAVTEHFSGTFDADAPQALMLALAGDRTLRVEHTGNEIIIRSHHNGD